MRVSICVFNKQGWLLALISVGVDGGRETLPIRRTPWVCVRVFMYLCKTECFATGERVGVHEPNQGVSRRQLARLDLIPV